MVKTSFADIPTSEHKSWLHVWVRELIRSTDCRNTPLLCQTFHECSLDPTEFDSDFRLFLWFLRPTN